MNWRHSFEGCVVRLLRASTTLRQQQQSDVLPFLFSRLARVFVESSVAMHSFLVTSGTQDRKKGSGRGPRGAEAFRGQRLIFESKNRVLFQLL